MIEKSGSVAIVQSTKRRSQKPGGSHKPMATSYDLEKRLAFVGSEEFLVAHARFNSLMSALDGRKVNEERLMQISRNYAAVFIREKYGHNHADLCEMIHEALMEEGS